MQPLTQAPRLDLTEDQVRNLLTADYLTIACGLEVVDPDGQVLADISHDLSGGEVTRDNAAEVHGSCRLQLADRVLAWGRDRVRPFMTLSDGVVTARFNLGVYVLTSPDTPAGESPVTYDVEGYDLLYLLQSTGPGDTFVAYPGSSYAQVVQEAIDASGANSPLIMDGTLADTQLPSPMVWAVTESQVTWLQIINDLLRSINYLDLWCDQDGVFRSGPYTAPADRAVEWTFDTNDTTTNLVGEERTRSADAWGIPNWWRFIRKQAATQPTEGNGLYTVTNQSDGPTSVDAVGRLVRKVLFIDAADQATLQSEGDKIVAADLHHARSYDISVDPLPIAGHMDVVQFVDEGTSTKCQVRSWNLPLDGSQGEWKLEIA